MYGYSIQDFNMFELNMKRLLKELREEKSSDFK